MMLLTRWPCKCKVHRECFVDINFTIYCVRDQSGPGSDFLFHLIAADDIVEELLYINTGVGQALIIRINI